MSPRTHTRTLLVTGSRHLEDSALIACELHARKPWYVIVGDCPTGVDAFVRIWCAEHDIQCEVFRARWKLHGPSAGPRRNQRMVARAVELGNASVLAFPRGGRGTADCMGQARRAGLLVETA